MDNSAFGSVVPRTLTVVFISAVRTARPGRRSTTASDLLCAVVVVAVVARFALPGVWRIPTVQAWTLVFGAVCVQAAPYVVLGVALSAAVTLVPDRRLRRLLPRRATLAVPVAAVLGVALPGCECGSVPLAAGLLRRGVPAGAAVSLMLSAPATNPVVLAATAAAFPGRPGVVAARFAASLTVAVGAGWWTSRGPTPPNTPGEVCAHEHSPGPGSLASSAARDLAQSLGLLTFGAASAATVGVLVPLSALDVFARNALGGVLTLGLLAVVLAVCSEADAFIASSLTQFSITAQLTFMVVGPVVDLKLLAMQTGVFGGRFTARLAAAAFLLAIACAALAARWLA